MKVTKENIDDLNAVLTVNIEKKDYQDRVDNTLKEHRKSAQMKGFRQGKVPMGLIKKMYGKHVMLEEINKVVSEALNEYIQKNEDMKLLGEPIANEDQETIDFDKEENFTLKFDVGLNPEHDIELNKRIKIPYYKIKADDKLIDEYIENYAKNFGELVDADVSSEESYVTGKLTQLDDDGNPLEDGIVNEKAKVAVSLAKNDDIKARLVGLKKGDTVDFDIWIAFPNETEIAGLLNIKKEEAKDLKNKMFRLEAEAFQTFKEAEIDQELFDKVFGKDEVTSVEEFREKISEQVEQNFMPDIDYKFMIDAKDKLVDKFDQELPENFLKRWLLQTNKELTKEKIEEDWDNFVKVMKWEIITNEIAKQHELDLKPEELLGAAKSFAESQFSQYGMSYIPGEQLEKYAQEILKDEDTRRKIADKAMENKIMDVLKETIKLDEKTVSFDKFKSFFEDKNNI
ncbi:MAG: trigger factor [Bacteroidota bacterium]|nr:trigger factor [Bacteroidota bacterium]